jgi:DNA-directed RNA polymerase subunit RPC12/RpoP
VGVLLDDEEYGISCGLCGTRLAVRPSQVGQTVTCPDCYSPVLVKPRPKQDKPKPVEYEEAELFKLSDPVERPSPMYLPPGVEGGVAQALGAPGLPAGSATTGNLMKDTARELLAKARAEQEAEEAEQREVSPDRFTGGLFAFLVDPQALGWLAILAVWLEVVMSLFHYASSRTMPEGAAQLLAQFGSLAATVGTALLGLGFLFAAAACAVAIIQDTAHGRSRIENWPGVNFLAWGGSLFYVLSAGFLSFLPGAVVGFILGYTGITGTVLLVGAATFVLLFPPIFLSMLESGSAFAPASSEVWASVRERPAPWRLAFLLTAVATVGGLIAFAISFFGGCLAGLLGAFPAVACGMTYFRAVGEHTAGG